MANTADGAGEPLLTGQNVPVRVFIDKQVFGDDRVNSVKITEVATEFRDDHVGESRSKTDKQVDGYDADVELHQSNGVLIQALINAQAARDANQAIPEVALLFTFEKRDGSLGSASYLLSKCTTKFDLDWSRKDRVKMRVSLRAEDCQPVVAATP